MSLHRPQPELARYVVGIARLSKKLRKVKVIALWAELTQLEAKLACVGGELREAESMAARLGLSVPRAKETPRPKHKGRVHI